MTHRRRLIPNYRWTFKADRTEHVVDGFPLHETDDRIIVMVRQRDSSWLRSTYYNKEKVHVDKLGKSIWNTETLGIYKHCLIFKRNLINKEYLGDLQPPRAWTHDKY